MFSPSRLILCLWLLVFLLSSAAFIPLVGVQEDEAFFAAPLYEANRIAYEVEIGGARVPLMLLSYLGALKSWVYKPVLLAWEPSAWSLRLPVVLLGVAVVLLFYRLVSRCAPAPAAAIGAALLASDSSFLLTTTFDWGPVVLQHLLLLASLLLVLRAREPDSGRWLAAAAFLWGLALWHKFLFTWTLAGLGVAAAVVYPRHWRLALQPRVLVPALMAFAAGAAPLIVFNIAQPGATVGENIRFTSANWTAKAKYLAETLDGLPLFGYLVRLESPRPRPGASAFQRASGAVDQRLGRYRSFSSWVVAGAAIAAIFLPAARRLGLFLVTAILISWLAMLFSGGAWSVHHVILLYPLPHFLVAVVAAALWRRPRWRLAVGAGAAILVAVNLLVLNRYYTLAVRHGPGPAWTDAIFPLREELERMRPSTVVLCDWGMLNNLIWLGDGRLPLRMAPDAVLHNRPSPADTALLAALLARPATVFVSHTEKEETFSGANARLDNAAAALGYRFAPLRTVHDRNGCPIFQVRLAARAGML